MDRESPESPSSAAETSPTPGIASVDVPQADDLDKVRTVVSAATAADMMASGDIAAATGFSLRHVEYRLRAALLLGLLCKKDKGFELTAHGKGLLATKRDSERERRAWLDIVNASSIVGALAPDLFAEIGPSRDDLAARIAHLADVSATTAARRAATLLSWRRRLQSRQLELFPEY